jgi:hypothetical protein
MRYARNAWVFVGILVLLLGCGGGGSKTAPTVTTNPSNLSLLVGAAASFSAAASGNPVPDVQWQQSADAGATFTNVPGATATTLAFTATLAQNGYQYRAVFTNSAGSATTTAATLTVTSVPVVVTTNPTNLSVAVGANASFSAAATGSPVPTVQWQQSADAGVTFTNVPGATATTLAFTATLGQNGYKYRAVFTNAASSATTTAATLTVIPAVVVTTNPSNLSVSVGANASFSAAATGNPVPTVQWQQSTDAGVTFTNVPGATATTLSFTVTLAQNGNQYRAVFTNSASNATTIAANLTVTAVPVVVTTNPTNLSVSVGASASFTAAATGNPVPTVQWQQSADAGATFTNVPGATTTTLAFTATLAQNGYLYRAVFTNIASSATTTAATLTVLPVLNVVVTTNPSNLSVAAGASASFSAAATGNPAPTVQWQQSVDAGATFTNVPGATTTTLAFTATLAQNGYQYRAVFTNSTGSATTTAAILTVLATGPQWHPASAIESNVGSGVIPFEAADANGNIVAIWAQASSQYISLWANRYDAAAGTWGTAQLISSGTDTVQGGYPGQYSLAVDASGNALAVWAQAVGAANVSPFVKSIWSSSYDVATHTWHAPVYLSGDLTQPVTTINQLPAYPQVAMDGSGHAFAVWEQNNGLSSATQNNWAARYTTGAGWAPAQAITTDNNVGAGNRRIAFDAAGNATVTYVFPTVVAGHADVRVKAVRYSAGTGTWSPGQFIAADTGQSVLTAPQLAVAPNGDALAIWTQSDGIRAQVIANRYSAAGATWGTEQAIDSPPAGDSNDAQVAMDTSGNAWAVWSQGSQIWGRHCTAGGTWGIVVALEANHPQVSRFPQVAFDANGNAMAVWTVPMTLVLNGPFETLISASYWPVGGSWATPQVLESVAGQSGDPQVVMDATGRGMAIWDKMDAFPGVNTTIWAARFQ